MGAQKSMSRVIIQHSRLHPLTTVVLMLIVLCRMEAMRRILRHTDLVGGINRVARRRQACAP